MPVYSVVTLSGGSYLEWAFSVLYLVEPKKGEAELLLVQCYYLLCSERLFIPVK